MQLYTDYGYQGEVVPPAAGRLLRPIEVLAGELSPSVRVLELGCGTGFWAGWFAAHGCTVVGVDADADRVETARRSHPAARFEEAVPADDLLDRLGEHPFDLVLSTRSFAGLRDPAAFARISYALLRPGGRLIGVVPASGLLRDAATAVSRARDTGGDATRLWSRRAVARLLGAAGYTNVQFRAAGRLPLLSGTTIFAADRPLHERTANRETLPPLVA